MQLDDIVDKIGSVDISSNQKPKDLIYYLPIDQTIYQKNLIELIVKLHRPHLLPCLKNNVEDEEENMKILKNFKNSSETDDYMDNQSMFDTFVFNVNQVNNHPTLLVDHYIPKNLLLLDTKENLTNSSYKYLKISEILDKLTLTKQQKTIIINVSNAKEMDLVESILIGKTGLQYYRFSGASLYYDNHGSFDFNKKQNQQYSLDDELHNGDSIAIPAPNSSSSTNMKNKSKYCTKTDKRKKKKGGRPSNAEKKAREAAAAIQVSSINAQSNNHNNNYSNNSHNDGGYNKNNDGNSNTKTKERDEEYTPRLSKNNPNFMKIQSENKNKKINVYLILSNQLKYLIKFEELRSDLIISLDSNLDQISLNNFKIPILKPIIINSLEHFELKLRMSKKFNNDSVEFNKLLTMFTISNRSNIQTTDQSNASPISDQLINWILDPSQKIFPYPTKLDNSLGDFELGNLYEKTKNSLLNLNFTTPYEMDSYIFFDPLLKTDDDIENGNKRIKLEELAIPSKLSYKKYQQFLMKLIYEKQKNNNYLTEKKYNYVKTLHLDQTKRQDVLDKRNVEIGELFKKFQDLKTQDDAKGKQIDKLNIDNSRLLEIKNNLQDRFDKYRKISEGEKEINENELNLKEGELNSLNQKIESLEKEINKTEISNDSCRVLYQEKSSRAAELSNMIKSLKKSHEVSNIESKGLFKELKEKSVKNQIDDMKAVKQSLDSDNKFLEDYVDYLDGIIKQRHLGDFNSARIRNSRNATPY